MDEVGAYTTTPEKAQEIADASGDIYPSHDSKGSSHITIPSTASTLSKEELIDRIKGIIYGKAKRQEYSLTKLTRIFLILLIILLDLTWRLY
jgi:hypothetical protein